MFALEYRHNNACCEADMTEKRRSYRLPAQDEFTKATIQSGRNEWPATLVNESAGGFLVATSPDAGLAPGESAIITLCSGSYLVEIVHTRLADGKLHFGARRFDDELQPRPRVAAYRGWGRGGAHAPRSVHGVLFFGAYAAITVLAVFLVLGGRDVGLAKTLLRDEHADRAGTFSSLPTNFTPIDWKRIQSLHGINSLASEQIRRAIGLSEEQQQSLDRVFSDTERRLRELYDPEHGLPGEELTRQSSDIIDQTVQRVLCTLTDRQIEIWRQELILGEAPAMEDQQASTP
jgi:hypothetical protein